MPAKNVRDFSPDQRRVEKVDRDSSSGARCRRLERVNKYLADLKLPPFHWLGDWIQGEIEIIKPMWHQPQGRMITAVYFMFQLSKDNYEVWPLIFNNDQQEIRFGEGKLFIASAICAVVLNNERFVVCRQHRPTLSGYDPNKPTVEGFDSWPWEFPRGFNPAGMLSLPVARLPYQLRLLPHQVDEDGKNHRLDIPSAITRRKIAPLLMDERVCIRSVELLGLSPENTGKDRNLAAIYRMDIEVDPKELDDLMRDCTGTERIHISYPTFEEAFAASNRWPDFHQNGVALFMMLRVRRTPAQLAALFKTS